MKRCQFTLICILQRNWKASGCPPFEKQPVHFETENVDFTDFTIPDFPNTTPMGSEELARLWGSSMTDLDSARYPSLLKISYSLF